jgi:hypothetical protein
MALKTTWIERAIKDLDPKIDIITIENPDTRDVYDQILNTIWLPVREHLQKTVYTYTPEIEPHIESEGRGMLTRKMTWMLHETTRLMYRGAIQLSKMSWIIENEFILSLDRHVDFRFIAEIIGNSRLSGYPPELTMHKHHANDADGYYQVTFFNGSGEGYYPGCEELIVEKIKRCIDSNVKMNEITIDNDWNDDRVGEFLTAALEVYETY